MAMTTWTAKWLPHNLPQKWMSASILLLAVSLLAFEPTVWLVRSWYLPGYDSIGWLICLAVVGLFWWGVTSPVVVEVADSPHIPLGILATSFVLRSLAQVLAINVVGALMLALDLYAVGLLAQLQHRRRFVSPFMLACLLCFALPVEPLMQRSIGFALQQLSAEGACSALTLLHDGVRCTGVRIWIDELDVLVDLPCSGARLLTLLLASFCGFGSLCHCSSSRLLAGLGVTLIVALAANSLRIVLLALGLRYAELLDVEVMAEPTHSIIGLACLGLGVCAIASWFNWARRAVSARALSLAPPRFCGEAVSPSAKFRFGKLDSVPVAVGVLLVALLILNLRARPLDLSAPLPVAALPLSLAGIARRELPLSKLETDYFAAYGGRAARASYGANTLLQVTTTSPLRHLHAPDMCFEGAGYAVSYVGADFTGVPAAVYRSRGDDGTDLRVAVTYVSASGRVALSVAEVVWYWLADTTEAWTMVQMVGAWDADEVQRRDWYGAVARAYNL